MGNNKSAEIKNRYELGRYRIRNAGYDSNLGNCEIIHIEGMKDLCIQRELDPTEYNEDIEIGTINNQFTKECKAFSKNLKLERVLKTLPSNTLTMEVPKIWEVEWVSSLLFYPMDSMP